MKFLKQNEKVTLVILITSALIMIIISIYLGVNSYSGAKKNLNNNIHVIDLGGYIEDNFDENYKKYQNKIGHFDINFYDNNFMSSDIIINDWNILVNDINYKYNSYDAFIIKGEPDTLTYTASALSFMIENLRKPIIITNEDLISSLIIASNTDIPEVMIFSKGKLLRGCRAVSNSSNCQTSPNYPFLNTKNSLIPPRGSTNFKLLSENIKVIIVKIFPGIDSKYLLNSIKKNRVDGVIFELYGEGSMPINQKMIKTINFLSDKGIIMVAVSQCKRISNIKLDIRLTEAGILSGYDMTSEAAYAKLCFLMSNISDNKLIGQLMEQSFRGEMTI